MAAKFLVYLLGCMLYVMAGSPAHAVDPADLLPPEQAFKLTVTAKDATTLHAQWDIAAGYYLYRSRFQFSSDEPGIQLGTARFPQGKIKNDKFFGEMEIYRQQVGIDIPITRDAAGPEVLHLKTVSQGCADAGVCYPPQTQTVALTLPALNAPGAAPKLSPVSTDSIGGFLDNLGAKIGKGLGLSNS
ncbi:MAG TPA: protein-disulfide reductase DsbD N-terminal domain-containing protein, partial [Gammaproteobacteria bacterium]|nr:protein-disulfide reductase DsbD N-terminal domain-containing protein [Gammaproteobacteria bacterium]